MSVPSKREEAIFEQALGIETPDAREAWLREACGDDAALLEQLQALLDAHDRAGKFLEHKPSAPEAPSPDAAAFGVPPSGNPTGEPAEAGTPNQPTAAFLTEKSGDRIGRYKLLEQIGEGGMGTVWMAEQEEPVRRRVALKIIKLGMDTRSVIARFEAERQALALMDHPNIAKVFDGGVTGHPPPSDGPSPVGRERVAEGRVRDRGEWRGAGGEGAANSQPSTANAQLPPGRPYFVMELVRGLSVTKYCDAMKFSTRDRLELFGQVCRAVQHAHQKGIIHRDLKPSNILVTEQDGRPVVKVIDFGIAKATEARLTDKTLFTGFQQWVGTPTYMSPEQAGLGSLDIDTRSDTYTLGVVLYELLTGRPPFDTKELLKSGFEAMLRTIRETEPVKPSTRLKQERTTRPGGPAKSAIGNPKSEIPQDLDWIVMKCLEKDRNRRYETPNALAADLERYLHDEPVVARPPSAAYRWQKFVRKHRAGVAVAAGFLLLLTIATVVSTALALWANRERTAAWSSDAEARAVLKFFREKILAAARPEGQDGGLGYDITLRAAVDAAEPGIARAFTNQPLVEAAIRDALGDTYANLGDHPAAHRQHQQAWELFQAGLGTDHPNTLGAAHGVAVTLHEMGDPARAVPLFEDIWRRRQATQGTNSLEALRAMCALGSACRAAGQITRAVFLLEAALPLLRTSAGPRASETLGAMNFLAMTYRDMGRRDETIRLFEEVLRARRENPRTSPGSLASSMNNLAKAYEESGRFTNGVPLVNEALELAMSKLGPDHPTTLKLMNTRGLLTLKLGQVEEALPQLMQALNATQAKRGPDHPDTAGSMLYVAIASFAVGKTNEAVELLKDVLRARRKTLGPDHPETLSSITDLGVAFRRTGRVTNALPLLEEAQRKSLASFGADHPTARRSLDSLVIAYVAAGRLEDASRLFTERLAMPNGNPRPEETDAILAIAALAQGCKEAGRFEDAAAYFQQASRLRAQRLGRDNAEVAQWLMQAGDCHLRQGNAIEAEPLLRRAMPVLEATRAGLSPTFQAQGLLGAALLGQKKFTEAEPLLLQAHAGLAQPDAARPSPSRLVLLNDVARQLVRLYEDWGKPEQAAHWREKLNASATPR